MKTTPPTLIGNWSGMANVVLDINSLGTAIDPSGKVQVKHA